MINSHSITVAIDAMGGDYGPSVVVPGAVKAAQITGAKIILVGNTPEIEDQLALLQVKNTKIEIVHASDVANMDEKPSDILRRKKNSSIQIACRLVKEGLANAIVSAGHSGASVACGMFIIGRITGVERPALASILPTEKNPLILLDVGATVDCKPYHLFQFGLMGHTCACDLLNIQSPRGGILSIGEEEGIGNTQVKEAYELLKMAKDINFTGNVEGRDLFTGNVDVTICDGFVGNVALKLSEGLSSSLSRVLRKELFSSGIFSKIGTFLAKNAFKNFSKLIDYAEYGGAPLLGLKGIFIVSHGSSNEKAICNATKMAVLFEQKETNKRLIDSISLNEELTRFGHSC